MKLRDNDFPVRTDRLSGKSEFLTPGGWTVIADAVESKKSPTELPSEQVGMLTGQATITGSSVEVHVYNGSHWTASEITVLLTVVDAQNNQVLSRAYSLIPQDVDSTPQSDSVFHNSLGFALEKGQTWTWSITGAKGRPE
jgi:uncharacterized protein (DUF111 family)